MFEDLTSEEAVAAFNERFPVGSHLWFGGVGRLTCAPARVAAELDLVGLPVIEFCDYPRPVPLRFIANVRPPAAPALAERGLTLEHGAVRCQRCGAVTGDLEHDKVCRGPTAATARAALEQVATWVGQFTARTEADPALPRTVATPFMAACGVVARWAAASGADLTKAIVNEMFARLAALETDREIAEVKAGKLRALLDATLTALEHAASSLEAVARWDHEDGDMASLRAYATNRAAVARQALRDDGTTAAATAPPPMPTADTRAADEGRPAHGPAVTAVVSGLMLERDQARTDARALAAALTAIENRRGATRLSGALAEVVARALTYPNAGAHVPERGA